MLSRQQEQLERLEAVENERRLRNQGSTFSQFAESDAATPLGRFKEVSNPTVIGATKVPQYPAAYLQHDPVPDEPPTGVNINEHPPVGELHELRASIANQVGPVLSQAQTGDPTAAPSNASVVPPRLMSTRVGSPPLSTRTYRRA
jgi:hypothetical protein